MKVSLSGHLNYFFFLLFVLILFLSCRKEKIELKHEEFRLPDHINLYGLYFTDEFNGFLVGGEKGVAGALYKTMDGGQSWNLDFETDKYLRDVSFYDSQTGYICGDSILIIKTSDGGITWEKMEYPWLPPDNYILPLSHIEHVDDTVAFISGGAYFDRGLVFKTRNGGQWWQFSMFHNEIATSYFKSDTAGIFGGYGLMTTTQDGGLSYQPIDIKGDFYRSFYFLSDNSGFACGYNGGIYETNDGGLSWESIYNSNGIAGKRIHLNDIFFRDNEKGMAVGNNGEVLITNNGGDKWTLAEKFTDENLFSISSQDDNTLWITAGKGYLFTLDF